MYHIVHVLLRGKVFLFRIFTVIIMKQGDFKVDYSFKKQLRHLKVPYQDVACCSKLAVYEDMVR